jgi:hypothetical protein
MTTATLHISRARRALAAALALLATLTFAARAEALPAKFWGVVPQSTLGAEQFQRLARGGVDSVRVSVDWAHLQSHRGGPIDWDGLDTSVERATLAGIEVLPVVTGAPSWAVPGARVPGGGGSRAPGRLPVSGVAAAGWKSMLRQAAERYGPNGSFWAAHPSVPVRPIRVWQIWNEPNFKYFVTRPNPADYGRLVKLSHAALKSVDPGARVLLAGLFARPKGARNLRTGKHKSLNWFASDFIERMYATNPGIKSRFDGVALHPYAFNSRELPLQIQELRGVLAENRDSGKGIWVTELGWSSGPPTPANLFAKGPAGQAKQLSSAFALLRSRQARWRIRRVYWFSVDDLAGSCNFCDGSGLFGSGFAPKRSWFAYVRFAGGAP